MRRPDPGELAVVETSRREYVSPDVTEMASTITERLERRYKRTTEHVRNAVRECQISASVRLLLIVND